VRNGNIPAGNFEIVGNLVIRIGIDGVAENRSCFDVDARAVLERDAETDEREGVEQFGELDLGLGALG